MLRPVPSPWLGPISFHVIWNRWRLIDSHPLCPSNQGTSQGQLGCYSKARTKGGQIRNHQASGYRRNFPMTPWASLRSWISPSLASSASCLNSYLPSQACFKWFVFVVFWLFICFLLFLLFPLTLLLTLKLAVILPVFFQCFLLAEVSFFFLQMNSTWSHWTVQAEGTCDA